MPSSVLILMDLNYLIYSWVKKMFKTKYSFKPKYSYEYSEKKRKYKVEFLKNGKTIFYISLCKI